MPGARQQDCDGLDGAVWEAWLKGFHCCGSIRIPSLSCAASLESVYLIS